MNEPLLLAGLTLANVAAAGVAAWSARRAWRPYRHAATSAYIAREAAAGAVRAAVEARKCATEAKAPAGARDVIPLPPSAWYDPDADPEAFK